jgi:hypothetical protein
MDGSRPAVSRETRHLLAVVLISLAVLWVLARIRFPDQPPTPNPMPPVLAQLSPPSALEDIVSTVATLQQRLEPALVAIDAEQRSTDAGAARVPAGAALRLHQDLGVMMARSAAEAAWIPGSGVEVVARDPASHLTVIRLPVQAPPQLELWSPRRLQNPRFVIAADASAGSLALTPVFVGSLAETESAVWPGSIWAAPEGTNLRTGSFVFSPEGALAGLVIEHEGRVAIVPGVTVLAEFDRMIQEKPGSPGSLGIQVQPLGPDLAAAVGSAAGVVVTWVDRQGAASGQLAVTDVIEEIDGQPIATPEHWHARIARLAIGESVVLEVRRRNEVREVRLTAGPVPAPADEAIDERMADRPLGLTLRTNRGIGAAVVRVAPGSAAERAGLLAGDLITVIDDIEAPTPQQISRLYAAAPGNQPLVIAITRAETHRVLTLAKQW